MWKLVSQKFKILITGVAGFLGSHLAEKLNSLVKEVGIDYDIRGMEKPSDHAPIWTEFKL